MKADKDKAVLDVLIRDELAAVETYRQALSRVGDDPEGAELERLSSEHEEAAALLQEQAEQLGARPAESSGAWGSWARAVEGTAQLFGNKAALKALREGEEHAVHDYERALREQAVDGSIKTLIRTNLLPRTRAHVPVLDRFLRGGG